MTKNQSNKEYLQLLIHSGVDFFTKNQPNDLFATIEKNNLTHKPQNNIILPEIKTINDLKTFVDSSLKCSLKKTANKTVIGDGNPNADLMIIGEAPGKDEDEKGLPFVGKAGQLLTKMLMAINLDRKNIYVTNAIPWRPPNNRTPTEKEILECLPFLQKIIEIIQPKIIFLLGTTATKAILSTPLALSKLRGKWHQFKTINMEKNVDVLVSYHPAYLLRSPQYKKEAWIDLKKLQIKIKNENENENEN